jgi:hypothetical protein
MWIQLHIIRLQIEENRGKRQSQGQKTQLSAVDAVEGSHGKAKGMHMYAQLEMLNVISVVAKVILAPSVDPRR